jgi:TIR domain-containing protein
MSVVTVPTVFISYRREDSAGHAGRLYDALATRFGDDNVFMDVELAPGIDFVERITTVVGACRSLLVVIGPDWAAAPPGGGASRLEDPGDFVRLEVETALARDDLTVIPLLVAGARMPRPEQLPPSLRALTRRNALELSDLRWRYDVGRLEEALDELALREVGAAPAGSGRRAADAVAPATAAPRVPSLVPLLIEGIVVAAIAGMIGYEVADALVAKATNAMSDGDQIAHQLGRRAITWTFVGGALGGWIALRRGERRSVPGRVLAGLLLGAAAGAASGAIFSLLAIAPTGDVGDKAGDRIDVGALAAVGLVLGAGLGALWTPRRVAVGGMAGLTGAVIAQLLLNAADRTEGALAVGLRCVAIAGFALVALLALDVRAATRAPPVTASTA